MPPFRDARLCALSRTPGRPGCGALAHRLPRGPCPGIPAPPQLSRPRGPQRSIPPGNPRPYHPNLDGSRAQSPVPARYGPCGSHLPQRRHPWALQFSRCRTTWPVRPSVSQPAGPRSCRRSDQLEPGALSVLTAGACALGARGGTGARGGGQRAAASGEGPGPRRGELQASALRPRPVPAAWPPGALGAHGPGSTRQLLRGERRVTRGQLRVGVAQAAPGGSGLTLLIEQVLTALESPPARPTHIPNNWHRATRLGAGRSDTRAHRSRDSWTG